MYAIVQNTNNIEKIIGFVNSIQDFHLMIEKISRDLCDGDPIQLMDISAEEIRSNDNFKNNFYLVKSHDKITLNKKYSQLNMGIIYNTVSPKIVELYSWTTIPVEYKNSCYPHVMTTNIDPNITSSLEKLEQ